MYTKKKEGKNTEMPLASVFIFSFNKINERLIPALDTWKVIFKFNFRKQFNEMFPSFNIQYICIYINYKRNASILYKVWRNIIEPKQVAKNRLHIWDIISILQTFPCAVLNNLEWNNITGNGMINSLSS